MSPHGRAGAVLWPRCAVVLWVLAAVVLVAAAPASAQDFPQPTGGGIDDGFRQWVLRFVSLLWSWIIFLFRSVIPALARAINEALNILWRNVLDIVRLVRDAGLRLLTILHGFWARALRPLFAFLWRQWSRLQTLLTRVFGPIFTVLSLIAQRVREVYNTFVRPVLDAIDLTRRVLAILSRFGVEFAEKIDAALARLEHEISRRYLQILGFINQIADTLDRIITADFLFQRVTLLASIRRDFGFIVGDWWTSQTRPLTDEEREELTRPLDEKPIETHLDETRDAILLGAGPLAAKAREAAQDVTLILGRLGRP